VEVVSIVLINADLNIAKEKITLYGKVKSRQGKGNIMARIG